MQETTGRRNREKTSVDGSAKEKMPSIMDAAENRKWNGVTCL